MAKEKIKNLEKYITPIKEEDFPKVNWEQLVSDRKDAETGREEPWQPYLDILDYLKSIGVLTNPGAQGSYFIHDNGTDLSPNVERGEAMHFSTRQDALEYAEADTGGVRFGVRVLAN